ncbi:MAG: NAD(P)H-dependent oxidoreductase [Puniceicoccales bacterium]|jgi:modulator of drug activity B|nr:NAD(P)H-dependent oxidoreductase [Puniceicoccales bacterium]
MSHILIINGAKKFAHSEGRLNNTLAEVAATFLKANSHEVQITAVEEGYDSEQEVEKILWADVLIYQMPGWWMGPPWIIKKYIDDVFTAGHGKLYANDGRSRFSDAKYGSGGLVRDKKYMISVTWNAPLEAFDDPKQFFGGVGVDGVYLPVHKANQFLGMKPLPTFICNDVIKQPDIDQDIARYQEHLQRVFGAEK